MDLHGQIRRRLLGRLPALILGFTGFRANEAQGPATIFAMRFILGPVSAFFLIMAALLVQRYPLDAPRGAKDPE